MTDSAPTYRLYGMDLSYFTRKLQGYLDYKRIPYRYHRYAAAQPEARAAGWPGGVPVVNTPDGGFMWDTTSMILHLEGRFPEPSVLPDDPVQRFLCFAIEDVADEWFYRVAVGSRWFYEENRRFGSWELARDLTFEIPLRCRQAADFVISYMTATCEPFGVTAGNIDAWIEEIFKPWIRVLNAHLDEQPFLFGSRPSLADFAVFGGNAAHFINDPLCRQWMDDLAPAVVKHTQRLITADEADVGSWSDDVPETLVAILRDMGRLYLPWVSRATREGRAALGFASVSPPTIASNAFLDGARATLLARYACAKSGALDSVLERAGILPFYADYASQAGTISDYTRPPQPKENRPFAAPVDAETNLWSNVSQTL